MFLFKAKTTKEDWVIEGYPVYNQSTGELVDFIGMDENGKSTSFRVNPETIGLYSGYEDKNGNRIFQHDTVVYEDKGRLRKGKVEYGKIKDKMNTAAFTIRWDSEEYWRTDLGYWSGKIRVV